MANNEDPTKSLHDMFTEGLNLYNSLEKVDEPTNSLNVQSTIKNAMRLLEDATRLVSLADIFSKNEKIEEVPSEHIQYFLLPALLGSLTLKLTSGDRKNIITTAEVYFKDFLERCAQYGICDEKVYKKSSGESKAASSELEQIAQQIDTRANKIRRFQEQKQLKEKLADLEKLYKSEQIDEEVKRNYYLTMVNLFIFEAADELQSIDTEKPLLEYMAKVNDGSEKPPKKFTPKPLQPIIITKDEVQKAVFGAGYPSLPTMTVNEFYEKRVADGIFPDPNKPKTGPMSMQEASLAGVELHNEDDEKAEKEKLEEVDDDENLQRMREMDEFKDEHRRGWGNRMNRS